MDVREKLVELCEDLETLPCCDTYEGQAEYLISHGVTMQECKLGVKETNADRIRSMSDEELASMLKDYKDCSKNCIISNGKHCYQICEEESVLLKWLQQPAEVSE